MGKQIEIPYDVEVAARLLGYRPNGGTPSLFIGMFLKETGFGTATHPDGSKLFRLANNCVGIKIAQDDRFQTGPSLDGVHAGYAKIIDCARDWVRVLQMYEDWFKQDGEPWDLETAIERHWHPSSTYFDDVQSIIKRENLIERFDSHESESEPSASPGYTYSDPRNQAPRGQQPYRSVGYGDRGPSWFGQLIGPLLFAFIATGGLGGISQALSSIRGGSLGAWLKRLLSSLSEAEATGQRGDVKHGIASALLQRAGVPVAFADPLIRFGVWTLNEILSKRWAQRPAQNETHDDIGAALLKLVVQRLLGVE